MRLERVKNQSARKQTKPSAGVSRKNASANAELKKTHFMPGIRIVKCVLLMAYLSLGYRVVLISLAQIPDQLNYCRQAEMDYKIKPGPTRAARWRVSRVFWSISCNSIICNLLHARKMRCAENLCLETLNVYARGEEKLAKLGLADESLWYPHQAWDICNKTFLSTAAGKTHQRNWFSTYFSHKFFKERK